MKKITHIVNELRKKGIKKQSNALSKIMISSPEKVIEAYSDALNRAKS